MSEENWREGLPADLAAAPFFRSADSLEQAIADMTHAADTASNSLRIPGPDAGDEAMQAFYARVSEKAPGLMPKPNVDDEAAMAAVMRSLGQPEKPDEYVPPEIEDYTMPDERVAQLRDMAHKAGLTKKQFETFIGQVMETDKLAMHSELTAHTTELESLRGEWGAAYQNKLDTIAAMMEKTGAPEALVTAVKNGDANTASLRWFDAMADSLGRGGEGQPVGDQGKAAGGNVPMTTVEAAAQLSEVESRLMPPPGTPRPSGDQLKYLTTKRMELMQLAYPDSSDDAGMLRAGPLGGA